MFYFLESFLSLIILVNNRCVSALKDIWVITEHMEHFAFSEMKSEIFKLQELLWWLVVHCIWSDS